MSRAGVVLWMVLAVPAFCQQTTETPPPADGSMQPAQAAEGKPLHIGGSVIPPKVLSLQPPVYSEEARRKQISGTVRVYLWVDENGNPSHIRVTRSVGYGLDEKAMEAVQQYKFTPAMSNGKPVKVDLYIEVNFRIYKKGEVPF